MRYTTDLTDQEWNLISYCFPKPVATGRRRKYSYRELLNGIFYLLRTGCQWRNLPKDLPAWQSTYGYFRRWTNTRLLEQIHAHLRDHIRLADQRQRQPTAAIIDSQSVKASETSGQRGYDAGKKVNGIKRHILVDTMGLLLMVLVLPASVQDREGARLLLDKALRVYQAIQRIWADGGYAGALVQWTQRAWGCLLDIVKRSDTAAKFIVLPRRWVVERTFGWLGRYRRLNRSYERRTEVAEAMVYLAMSRLMLSRWVKH
jgi:putative transposase